MVLTSPRRLVTKCSTALIAEWNGEIINRRRETHVREETSYCHDCSRSGRDDDRNGSRGPLASDVAIDPAYDDGWTTGDNGGTGFGAWTLGTIGSGGAAGHFIGDSSNNAGGGSGNINTAGESFGLYAEPGMVSEAFRPFTGALSVGQIFLIDFDNGWVDEGGTVGLGLQNSAGQNRIEFFFIGGQTTYKI